MVEQGSVPLLVVYEGAAAGLRRALDKEWITVGRAQDCDLVLPERQVSRYHARIERDEQGYLLRDLGSRNGTLANGEQVRDQLYRLRDGDEISLAGAVRLGFVAGDATLPLEESAMPLLGLELDEQSRCVRLGRRELDPPLSPAQFTLLGLLVQLRGNVATREDVVAHVWPDAVGGVTDQAVDALVYRLRERLAELDPDHNYVTTVRGHGFRFEIRR